MSRPVEVAYVRVFPDPRRPPARLPRAVAAEIFAHARETYPEECCGLLLGAADGPLRVLRATNVQNQLRARGESRRDARTGFSISDSELLEIPRAQSRGELVHGFYHSHVDAEAYLSETDQKEAIGPHGGPLYPGALHYVISVHAGIVRGAAVYEWLADERRFEGRRLELEA